MQSRLKQLRMSFGLDRQAFADLLGCSAATVEAWEKAKSAPDDAVALVAERFGIASEWIQGADVPVWGQRLQEVRTQTLRHVQTLSGSHLIAMISATTGERIAYVANVMRATEPRLFSIAALACWLGLSRGSTELMLAGGIDPGSPVIERASDLTGIPQDWFRKGPVG